MDNFEDAAWNKGYEAYFDGVPRDQNPHDEDNDLHDHWLNGWDKADSNDDSKKGRTMIRRSGPEARIEASLTWAARFKGVKFQGKLKKALAVIALDVEVVKFLATNDPSALCQVQQALAGDDYTQYLLR